MTKVVKLYQKVFLELLDLNFAILVFLVLLYKIGHIKIVKNYIRKLCI